MLGMILARGDYFSRDISFWVKTFVACFVSAFVLYTAKSAATAPLQTVFTMWFNLAFSGMLVSLFVILYQSEALSSSLMPLVLPIKSVSHGASLLVYS